MNENFEKRLKEYLDSECDDYDMAYFIDKDDTSEFWCQVQVFRNDNWTTKWVNFKYDETKDVLLIELSEDSFYETKEYDYSVKYFWMLVAPALFPNN